jgi:hypothetical protein
VKKAVIWTSVIALFVFLMGLDAGWWSSTDNDTTIPTLSEADGNDLVARLAKAEAAHGICYGWEVRNGSAKVVSVGSSRGVGVSADTCGRYAVVSSTISYYSASSESEDSADAHVSASRDLTGLTSSDLSRMGVDKAALIDEPAAATAYGALALPLLLAEKGKVQPLEPELATTTPTPTIGHPGSDFTASHRAAIISLSIFGGAALIGLVVGFILRRRRNQEG